MGGEGFAAQAQARTPASEQRTDHTLALRALCNTRTRAYTGTHTQSLTLDDGDGPVTRSFNMLRIGRLGRYFQSDDARVTGRWDNLDRQWVMDDSARNEIRKGLRMARQLIAPELVNIPVPAAEAL